MNARAVRFRLGSYTVYLADPITFKPQPDRTTLNRPMLAKSQFLPPNAARATYTHTAGKGSSSYIHNPESELIKFDDNLLPKEFIERFIKNAARGTPGRLYLARVDRGMLLTYQTKTWRIFS